MLPRCRQCLSQHYRVSSAHRPPFNPTIGAGMEVRSLVVGYTWAVCRAIASCAELLGVLRLLEEAASTLLQIPNSVDQPCTGTEAPDAELRSCRQTLLAAVAAAAAAPGEQWQLLRHHLYTSSAFPDLSITLLTGGRAAGRAAAAEAAAMRLTATVESSSQPETQRHCHSVVCWPAYLPSIPSAPALQSWPPTGCGASHSSSGNICLMPGLPPPPPRRCCRS